MASDIAFARQRRSGPVGSTLARIGVTPGVLFVAFMLVLWDGLPTAMIGFGGGLNASRYLYALIVMAGLGITLLRLATGTRRLDGFEIFSLFAFGWCTFVSILYSVFLYPQPASEWVTAIYTVTPLMGLFVFREFGCTLEDALKGFYVCAFFAAVIVLITPIHFFNFLGFYFRDSGFGTEYRIVLLKMQSTFAFGIGFAFMLRGRSQLEKLFHAFGTIAIFVNVAIVSESRISMAAMAIGIALAFFLIFRFRDRMISGVAGAIGLIVAVPYVISKYFANFQSLDDYLKNDSSATYRNMEIDYFRDLFANTFGFGFGYMGRSENKSNILAFAATKAGTFFGNDDYGMGLDDIGIWAALFQYGYIGLLIVATLNAVSAWQLIALARLRLVDLAAGVTGCFVIALLIGPLPANIFTLEWTGHCGAVIWFMAAEAGRRRKALLRSRFGAGMGRSKSPRPRRMVRT